MSAGSDICAPLRSGAWSPGGAGAFSTSFSDPGGTVAHIVSWALEYVSPLNDWLDELIGNEGQVSSFASTWRGVASSLTDYEGDLEASAHRISELEGRTARALRKLHDEIREVLGNASEWSTATAAALELAATIVTAVHDAVIGALSEIAGLIADLFGFSLNPFDKVKQLKQLSQRALGFIEVVGELIQRMFDAFEQLVQLLRSLVPLIQEGLLFLREQLGILIQRVSPFAGPLAGLLGGAAADLLAGDPRVTELDPDDLTDEQRKAWEEANGVTDITSLSDLITANGSVDSMGGTDRSVVDIMEVRAADGSIHYVVALPSTQDWGMLKKLFGSDFADTLKDYPPTNDLDSNIALMLMDNPLLATQYERGVMQAMSDAGVPPGADVVYSGFSQGGIMAANLASNSDQPYNTIGIVTNGSPISGFHIPPEVQVVNFEHKGDPVPHLSVDPQQASTGNPSGPSMPNHNQVSLPYPTDENGHQLTGVGDTHNNANYVNSVEAWQQAHPGEVPNFYGGTVIDHQQHTWGE